MKFNKWTLGLAAVGAVSLTSAVTARADGAGNLNPIQAAFAGITISGGVDTSIEWAIDPSGSDSDESPLRGVPFRNGKQDGFNLNVVELNIEKPLGEDQWASGFKVQLLFGPDAVGYNTSANSSGTTSAFGVGPDGIPGTSDDVPIGGFYGSGGNLSDFGVKQAYVNLRTPIGNGIDWKIGAFDTIVGYEVFESWNNPNFSRSWGYAIEPTQHTGVLGAYQFNDVFSAQFGVANTLHPGINTRNDNDGTEDYWCKSWMGSVALKAPDSWGSLAGSTFYLGTVYGWNGSDDQVNLYAGAVINTPVTGLTAGLAYDYAGVEADDDVSVDFNVIGLYVSYKATEKLSFHGRGELGWIDIDTDGGDSDGCIYGFTGTIQYDLWANVISRLELRYEASEDLADGLNSLAGSDGSFRKCGLGLYASIAYKF